MNKLCPSQCGKAVKGDFGQGDCRLCWLVINDERYAKYASDSIITPIASSYSPPLRSPACIHLNQSRVADRRGKSCVHKWVVSCDVHGKCTTGDAVDGVSNCRTCTDYQSPDAEPAEVKPVTFDRVVFINLKRRTDRLEAFRARQISHGWELSEPVIFAAIDGNKVGVPSYYTAGGGAWGCCRSHVRILEDAIADGVNSLLVLEDDVTWKADAWEHLRQFMTRVPSNWDQLMLGGQHQSNPLTVSEGVVKATNCQRTHAYAIRGDAMRDLLKLWYGCNTHIDHRMGPWQADYNVFAPDPFIFGQSAGRSDISGQRNPDKFWVPPSMSQPVIHLTAPRAVVDVLKTRGFHVGYDIEHATGYDVGLQNASKLTGAVRSNLIRKWLDAVLWEAASMENSVAACWHPDISAEELRAMHKGPILEIVGNTAEECLAQAPEGISLQKNYSDTHVVHLTAERAVAEAIQRLGFHIGNWRCPDSGHDHGLRKIAPLPHKVIPLKPWIDLVAKEASVIPNGVTTVWHPSIKPSEVAEAAGGRKVVVIKANSARDVVKQFREGL